MDEVDNILTNFEGSSKHPDLFLSVHNKTAEKFKNITKCLYDLTKGNSSEDRKTQALPELIIDNFDDEQIWQELELQNEPVISQLLPQMSRLATSLSLTFHVEKDEAATTKTTKKKVQFEGDTTSDSDQDVGESTQNDDDNASDEQSEVDDEEEKDIADLLKLTKSNKDYNSDESEEEQYLKELLDKATSDGRAGEHDSDEEESDANSEDDLDFDFKTENISKTKRSSKHSNETEVDLFGEEINSVSKKQKKKEKRKTEVDDKFFKLADMEEFLDLEDNRENKRIARERGELQDGEESEEASSEEDIDYFAVVPSEDEDGGTDLKYSDFFDPPDDEETAQEEDKETESGEESKDETRQSDGEESEGQSSDDEEKPEKKKKLKSSDLLEDSESEGEDVSQIFGGEKSSYQKRQERLKKKIADLEDAALAEKPWQLMGESQASSRPVNALLEEDLEFEQQTKTAPEITEETTKTLEDIIKQRIKDQSFDDVERKVKPKEEAFEYKKRITLDQEKSKLSLGEIYEQEYLQQAEDKDEETVDPEREEIKKMMTSLFTKLDALSNFHFTPKPAIPDVEIVNNLPAINMEEVQPLNFSENQTLAPEEIKDKKKKELKGDTEKTKTDKLRARREKKKMQRAKKKAKEKREEKLAKINPGLGNKYAKQKAMDELTKLSKRGKGVTVVKEEPDKKKSRMTSSTQFFKELQEEVTTNVRAEKAIKNKNKKKHGLSSSKLKL